MENTEILPNYWLCKPLAMLEEDNSIYILHTGLPEWFGKIIPAQSPDEAHDIEFILKGKENEYNGFSDTTLEIMAILTSEGILPPDVNYKYSLPNIQIPPENEPDID